jgi:hypothetical protein
LVFAPIFTVTYYNFVPLLLVLGAFLGWLYAERKPGAARPRPRTRPSPLTLPQITICK